ncbi:MAG TPA: cytochrome c oxidase subunit II [Longimicrobiales bacterium]
MHVHRYEKAVLAVTGALLLGFLGALFYSAFGMDIHVQSHMERIDPSAVRTTPPFDAPGVREVAPGRWEAVILGQAWSFTPNEIRVPAGAEVTFTATSADVVHGFAIEGTRVNMMLVPGQVSQVKYTFDEPGEHLLICHEYCGLGHHVMYGKVIVE